MILYKQGKVNKLKFLLRLICNRFMLSVIIIFLFALDFKFLTLNPLRTYSLNQPTVTATEYYEVELGAAKIFVFISYDGSNIHLVPTDTIPLAMIENPTIVAWYYYFGAVALANIIPFHWFFKKEKRKPQTKKK